MLDMGKARKHFFFTARGATVKNLFYGIFAEPSTVVFTAKFYGIQLRLKDKHLPKTYNTETIPTEGVGTDAPTA